MTDTLSGRCRCGQVSWRTEGPVLWAGHCHCESCRRASSAAFTSFFGVKRAGIAWRGKLAVSLSTEGRIARKFCPACGTHMTVETTMWPTDAHLYAASLDDPALFQPQAHFHYAERVPWVSIVDDLPKYPGSADDTEPLP